MENQTKTDASHANIISNILVGQFPDGVFSSHTFIGRGAVSSVYRVEVNGEPLAVKLHTAVGETISEYEREEYERERDCLMQAKAVGLPVPEVCAVGWLDNCAYSLQTFVPGVNGLEYPTDPLLLWKELGRLARLIHSIPVEDAESKWHRYLDSILASLTDNDVKMMLGMYAPHQQADLRRVFQRLRRQPFHYGLNHCDLHPKNTVVDLDGKVYLLDWGAASRDINVVPHTELAALLFTLDIHAPLFRAFVSRYGLSETEFQFMLPEVLAMDLAGCFWFADNPPRSEYGYELVAHAKRAVAEHLPLLTEWAFRED